MSSFVVGTNKFSKHYPVVELSGYGFENFYAASVCAEMFKIQDPVHDYFVIEKSKKIDLSPDEIRSKLEKIFKRVH